MIINVNQKPLFANLKVLLAVHLNLMGGISAERCKICLYWPVSIGVTAWQHPHIQLVNERGSFEVHGENRAGSEKTSCDVAIDFKK